MLSRLPYSLLVTSLALAVTAVPVESTELRVLTPDDFKQTIAHGVWYAVLPFNLLCPSTELPTGSLSISHPIVVIVATLLQPGSSSLSIMRISQIPASI